MNIRTSIIAAAAVVAALVLPTIAPAADTTMIYPASHSWGQIETTSVPGDPQASPFGQPRHPSPHRIEPYGQW